MSVVVFGSINMDLVAELARMPAAGETIGGQCFSTAPGGKGANQAVAAARLGASTRMIGCTGDDVFGTALRESLCASGVDDNGVRTVVGASGVAVILLEPDGANRIVIIPGANNEVGADELAHLEHVLVGAQVLLLQLEVPLDVVLAAAHIAQKQNVLVILDPAPAQALPDELYALADIITPNETEAAMLLGLSLDTPLDAPQAAHELLRRGARSVVIKQAEKGVYWTDGSETLILPAFSVEAVDTVAAGDAFNGALATALSEHMPIAEALRWGLAAGAIAVTRRGAQDALPWRADLLALLERDVTAGA